MTKSIQNKYEFQEDAQSLFLDSLLCEEKMEFESFEEGEMNDNKDCNFLNLLGGDLSWENEELVSLFSKEKQTHCDVFLEEKDEYFIVARRGAVEWMLKVKDYFGFSTLTALLSVNYFDRFLCSFHFQKNDYKPWMIHLATVACLSLAAKIEESKVPPLLDLQVDNTKYMFNAKSIKRMELLVMSTLQWRMNPITPFSYLDHIIRRLGLKSDLHSVFFLKCEALFLSALSDWRFVRYLPSVLATSTMLHVIHQVEPLNAIDYQNQVLSVLQTTKEKINGCYELIRNISNNCWTTTKKNCNKRKYEETEDTHNEKNDVYSCFENFII